MQKFCNGGEFGLFKKRGMQPTTKIKKNFCLMFILAEHFPLDIHDNSN